MKTREFRIIANVSRTEFYIQEKFFSLRDKFLNFFCTIFLGNGGFVAEYTWKNIFFKCYSLEKANEKLDELLNGIKAQTENTLPWVTIKQVSINE